MNDRERSGRPIKHRPSSKQSEKFANFLTVHDMLEEILEEPRPKREWEKPRQKRWSTNPDRRESEREKKRAEKTGRKKVKQKREQTPDSDPSSQTQSKNFVCLFPANFVFYSRCSFLLWHFRLIQLSRERLSISSIQCFQYYPLYFNFKLFCGKKLHLPISVLGFCLNSFFLISIAVVAGCSVVRFPVQYPSV